MALLQQGQRTQRETNRSNIECGSGPSLTEGDRRRERKIEDMDTKGERVGWQRERGDTIWESKTGGINVIGKRRNDEGGEGMERREDTGTGDCEHWMRD